MQKPIISADSHITEPPNTYIDFIDPKFRDRAPHMVRDERKAICSSSTGCRKPIPMGLVAAAGKAGRGDSTLLGIKFEELHRGGWDPEARLADQDRDGVAAEIIYPTVGHAALQPPRLRLQEGLLRRLQPLDRRVLLGPSRPAAWHRADRDALGRGGHRRPRAHQGHGPQGRDDAG